MKTKLLRLALYLVFALLYQGCSESVPEPTCVKAEVVGVDCDNRWYILHLVEDPEKQERNGSYIGQLQEGYVTTDNLPDAYKQPGLTIEVALDINSENSPLCTAVNIMYPTVRVKKVCAAQPSIRH